MRYPGTITPSYLRPFYRHKYRFQVMVHNHPSGDTTPSKGDVEMTRAVQKALETVGVQIHDHVVVGRGRHSSFKSLGLL